MIIRYDESYKVAWDRFVLKESANGTFLHTRNFLDYHGGKFKDCSVMFMKGNNIVAVIPANENVDGKQKEFISHAGSTFGGLIIGSSYLKIDDLDWIFVEFEEYLCSNDYSTVKMKMTSNLYTNRNTDIVEYYLYNHGYSDSAELGYYIDLSNMRDDEIMNRFNGSRRRSLKKALANGFETRQLNSEEEIQEFYDILCKNMLKFDTKPVHTYDELVELKETRLVNNIDFFGIYHENKMIAGSMVFYFGDKKVFHTQYLATDQEQLALFPSEFLYYALIMEAKKEQFQYISFGTATLENGSILNRSLAQFKEGFGTDTYLNRTFWKTR